MGDISKLTVTGSFIIGFDFSKSSDTGVLIVGTKTKGNNVEVINAFQGRDAVEVYNMLTTKK